MSSQCNSNQLCTYQKESLGLLSYNNIQVCKESRKNSLLDSNIQFRSFPQCTRTLMMKHYPYIRVLHPRSNSILQDNRQKLQFGQWMFNSRNLDRMVGNHKLRFSFLRCCMYLLDMQFQLMNCLHRSRNLQDMDTK